MSSQPNKSLADGMACFQELAANREPIGCRELARRLGMNVTRVNRLLMTLADIGLARQDEKRRYLPGPGIHVLAAQSLFGSGLLHSALPVLEKMGKRGCMVALGMLWRDKVCYLYHAHPNKPAIEGLGRVGLFPATRSGPGLVLLAEKDESEVRELFEGNEIPDFDSLDALLDELSVIRARGYAFLGPSPHRAANNISVALGSPAFASICYADLPVEDDVEEAAAELKAYAQDIYPTIGA